MDFIWRKAFCWAEKGLMEWGEDGDLQGHIRTHRVSSFMTAGKQARQSTG